MVPSCRALSDQRQNSALRTQTEQTVVVPSLPASPNSLLVRTTFDDGGAWAGLLAAVAAETVDGFRAYVDVIDDDAWAGTSDETVRAGILAAGGDGAVAFVVDQQALAADFPILVVDISAEARPSFRCIAAELWSVDNNLNLANMDWEEFADATDSQGIYRGLG